MCITVMEESETTNKKVTDLSENYLSRRFRITSDTIEKKKGSIVPKTSKVPLFL